MLALIVSFEQVKSTDFDEEDISQAIGIIIIIVIKLDYLHCINLITIII